MLGLSRSSWSALLAALFLVTVSITTWQLLLLDAAPPGDPPPPGETLSIALAPKNLEELPLDPTIHDVTLRILNNSAQPVKVVGFQGGCYGSCCFRAKPSQAMPFAIPPGTTADFIVELRVYTPGPFEAPMVVFVDQGGLRELAITVTGTGGKAATVPVPTARP